MGKIRLAGSTSVISDDGGSELLITLDSAYTQIDPGDRIIVRVDNITNSEIAIANPKGPRGFALNVGVAGPRGNFDGPVEVRYALDPTARVSTAALTTPTAQPTTTSTTPPPTRTILTAIETAPLTPTATPTATPTTTATRTESSEPAVEDISIPGEVSETIGPAPASDLIPVSNMGMVIAVALLALLVSVLVMGWYQWK